MIKGKRVVKVVSMCLVATLMIGSTVLLEENIKDNHGNYIKEVKTEYYKKGIDSYKKITTLLNSYECRKICGF